MELSGGQFLSPVRTLVATSIFAIGENAYRVLSPQPILRTDLDIGAEKSETIAVSDFSIQIFAVKFH